MCAGCDEPSGLSTGREGAGCGVGGADVGTVVCCVGGLNGDLGGFAHPDDHGLSFGCVILMADVSWCVFWCVS